MRSRQHHGVVILLGSLVVILIAVIGLLVFKLGERQEQSVSSSSRQVSSLSSHRSAVSSEPSVASSTVTSSSSSPTPSYVGKTYTATDGDVTYAVQFNDDHTLTQQLINNSNNNANIQSQTDDYLVGEDGHISLTKCIANLNVSYEDDTQLKQNAAPESCDFTGKGSARSETPEKGWLYIWRFRNTDYSQLAGTDVGLYAKPTVTPIKTTWDLGAPINNLYEKSLHS